jgi:hypothetical protein
MSVSQMRAEDRLDGASNWSPWKTRITFALEDLELWDIVQAPVVVPPVTAPSPCWCRFQEEEQQGEKDYL